VEEPISSRDERRGGGTIRHPRALICRAKDKLVQTFM